MRSKSAKMEPRWAQDRSKIAPRSFWIDFFSSSVFASFFDRFRLRFGAVLGAKMVPKIDTEMPGGALGGSRAALGSSWCGPVSDWWLGFVFLTLLRSPFWDDLGLVWGLLGSLFGSAGPFWDSLGGAFGKFGGPRTSATRAMAWPGGLREAIK